MGGVVKGIMGGGDDASDASKDAANIQAQAQREALDYLKEREKLPSAYSDAALKGLGAEYGMTLDSKGNVISDGMSLVDRAKASPFYEQSVSDAEQAVLRNSAATGGLRSGTANENLARANNYVLQNAYNQQLSGLQGLANLPSNANNIAAGMAGIGETQAQGIVGAAQSQNAGNQAGFGNMMGLAQMGMQAYSMFSDPRLKTNIKRIGTKNGLGWYEWEWNDKAKALGLSGKAKGYMANEVAKKVPEAIGEKDGYAIINTDLIEAA